MNKRLAIRLSWRAIDVRVCGKMGRVIPEPHDWLIARMLITKSTEARSVEQPPARASSPSQHAASTLRK
jgi:hypothetical protein